MLRKKKSKSKTKSGLSTSLRFTIAQHSRDILLLENFINLYPGGFVMNYKKTSTMWVCCYKIWSFSWICNSFFR